jgi:hypothetical protein
VLGGLGFFGAAGVARSGSECDVGGAGEAGDGDIESIIEGVFDVD